jgi:hypothetical protein
MTAKVENNQQAIDRVLYFATVWRLQRNNQDIVMIPDSHNTVVSLAISDLDILIGQIYANTLGKVTVTTNEEGQCVAVTRTDADGQILDVIWEVPLSSLGDDAHECLLDVVSHYQDFRTAILEVKAHNETTGSDELYWQKQLNVLDRMKAQAERALSSPDVAGPAITADVHKDAERYRAVISDPEVFLALTSHIGMSKQLIDGAVDAAMYDDTPKEDTQWQHRKGGIYTVLLLTSEPGEDKADKFPRSVVYKGEDGRVWTCTLESWYSSFKPL